MTRLRQSAELLRGWWFPLCLAFYVLLLGAATWQHTFWRDEAAPWLLARDNSLPGLLHAVHYEGHPPLWFLLMYGVTRLTKNPEWMKVPNLVATLVTAWMIVSARQLKPVVRLALIFSYFLLFEYGLIDRNYMLGVALLLVGARWMEDDRKEIGVALMLGGAALSSAPALIVAVCLYGYWVWPELGLERVRWGLKRWIGLAAFTASVVWAVAVILPPTDSGSVLAREVLTLGMRIRHGVTAVVQAYLPIPGAAVHFWNHTWLDYPPGALEWGVALVLVAGLLLYFRDVRVRAFFMGTTGLLLLEMAYTGRVYLRQVGWLFIVFVLAIILERGRRPETAWRAWMLTGILAVQASAGVYVTMISLTHPFSSSLAVVEFLRKEHLADAPLAFAPGITGLAVMAYSQRATAYYPERHGQASYVIWNRDLLWNPHMVTAAEMTALSQNGQRAVLITEVALSDEQCKSLDVVEIASFRDEIAYEYPYFIYRRLPAAGERWSQAIGDR